MLSIRAGYYTCHWGFDGPDEAKVACKAYTDAPPADGTEVEKDNQTFRLTDPGWNEADGVFTGTMWRVRTRNLPSVMKDGKMQQVGNDLAESASFAFMPVRREALVQYNHSGPRHGIVGSFFEAIGIAGPVSLTPVIEEDAIDRMKHAPLVRRLEFALGDIQDEEALRGAGLGGSIDQMKGLHGAHIRVEISLGHQRGSLSENVKTIAERLSEMVTGVKAVKVGVKEGEDKATEMLDLIGGRLFIDMNLPEVGKELDHATCRDRLRMALKDRQITSEESDDDEPTEDAAPAAEQSRAVLEGE
jgi:hypothetical protein